MKLFGYEKSKNKTIAHIFGLKISHKHEQKTNVKISEIYDEEFYNIGAQASYKSAKIILAEIYSIFPNIKSVLDVGCGVGTWLKAWLDMTPPPRY